MGRRKLIHIVSEFLCPPQRAAIPDRDELGWVCYHTNLLSDQCSYCPTQARVSKGLFPRSVKQTP